MRQRRTRCVGTPSPGIGTTGPSNLARKIQRSNHSVTCQGSGCRQAWGPSECLSSHCALTAKPALDRDAVTKCEVLAPGQVGTGDLLSHKAGGICSWCWDAACLRQQCLEGPPLPTPPAAPGPALSPGHCGPHTLVSFVLSRRHSPLCLSLLPLPEGSCPSVLTRGSWDNRHSHCVGLSALHVALLPLWGPDRHTSVELLPPPCVPAKPPGFLRPAPSWLQHPLAAVATSASLRSMVLQADVKWTPWYLCVPVCLNTGQCLIRSGSALGLHIPARLCGLVSVSFQSSHTFPGFLGAGNPATRHSYQQ